MSAPEIAFAVPGALATRTGGYVYDRRLISELRSNGLAIRHLSWPDGFPMPDRAAVDQVGRSLACLADDTIVIIDGLAFGTMPALAAEFGKRLKLVALVHHPLALETGAAPGLFESECTALRHARAVITTSAATAATLVGRYGVPAGRLVVAPPGTDPAPAAPRIGKPSCLLCVGTVTPRKGHDILVAALVLIRDLAWRCIMAGSLDRSPATTQALRRQIAAAGLGARLTLAGEVEDIGALYREADLFVLASRHEGYGMAYAEALAHGLPVVGTSAGAIPGLVPKEAGALVPPDDPAALANALRRLLTDRMARDAAAAASRRAGIGLPRWQSTAERVESLLQQLA